MIQPLFIIDTSVLKNMFEGEENANKLMNKFKELKYANKDVKAITTMSCLLRAIFLSDSEIKIKEIQKTLNFIVVHPSFADFKNEKAVIDEVLKLASILSGKK